jgi:biopolymer transport protein ExbB/TolQ
LGYGKLNRIYVRRLNMEESNPYAPPTETANTRISQSRLSRLRFWSAVAIPVSLITGLFFTIVGIMGAFSRMAQHTSINPGQISGEIRDSLAYSAIGILVSGVAIGVRLWSTTALRRNSNLHPEKT